MLENVSILLAFLSSMSWFRLNDGIQRAYLLIFDSKQDKHVSM